MILTDAHCAQCAVKDESRWLHLPGVATGRLDPPQWVMATGAIQPASAEDAEGTAHEVAHQVARLCGDDSQVVMPWRSLQSAVGRRDGFAQRGVRALVEAGWLEVETTGQKRGARTTWRLTVGSMVNEVSAAA